MKKIVWLLMVVMLFSFASVAMADTQHSDEHHMSPWNTFPATCTVDGTKIRWCNDCDFFEEVVLPAPGHHTWGEWEVKGDKKVRTCSVCGEKETEAITPVETTSAPVETTPAPVETTPAPVETTPAPVETTPAPVETTSAPTATPDAPCVEHVWRPWETVKEPTANEPGKKARMCDVCGAHEFADIPALGADATEVPGTTEVPSTTEEPSTTETPGCAHVMTEWYVQSNSTKQTCMYIRLCTVCGHHEYDTTRNAHKYGDWHVNADSTCSKAGQKMRICENCGNVNYVEIEKLPHTEVVIPGKAATCTEAGMTDGKQCTVCNEVTVKQEVIAALGHKEEILPAKAASCTETGLTEGKKCSVCGETLVAQQEIAKEKHQYLYQKIKPTTERKGYTLYKCKVCGDAYTKDFVDKLPTAVEVTDLGSIVFNGLGEAVPYTAVAEGKVLTIKAELDANAVRVLSLSLDMVKKFVADGYETINFVVGDHELVIPMDIFTQDMLQVILKDIGDDAIGYNFTVDCTVADNCTAKMEIKGTDAAVIDVTSVVTGLELD